VGLFFPKFKSLHPGLNRCCPWVIQKTLNKIQIIYKREKEGKNTKYRNKILQNPLWLF
jgi:hypothetical protein